MTRTSKNIALAIGTLWAAALLGAAWWVNSKPNWRGAEEALFGFALFGGIFTLCTSIAFDSCVKTSRIMTAWTKWKGVSDEPYDQEEIIGTFLTMPYTIGIAGLASAWLLQDALRFFAGAKVGISTGLLSALGGIGLAVLCAWLFRRMYRHYHNLDEVVTTDELCAYGRGELD